MKKFRVLYILIILFTIGSIVNNIIQKYINSQCLYLCLCGNAKEVDVFMKIFHWDPNRDVKITKEDILKYNKLGDWFLYDFHGGYTCMSPLYIATMNDDFNVIKLLIERGAEITYNIIDNSLTNSREGSLIIIENMKKNNIYLDYYSEQMMYVIMTADAKGEYDIIYNNLIDLGILSPNREKVLRSAARGSTHRDFLIALERLGINMRERATEFLIEAVSMNYMHNNIGAIKFFLERGGDPNAVSNMPVYYKRYKHKTKSGDITYTHRYQYEYSLSVPLITKVIIKNGKTDTLETLLKAGADPNKYASNGMTALQFINKHIHNKSNEIEERRIKDPYFTEKNYQSELDNYKKLRSLLIQYGAKEKIISHTES